MTTPRSAGRAHASVAMAFGLAALVLFALHLRLPNRSSWLIPVSELEAAAVPHPRFRLGSMEWKVDEYASAPSLEPFRREFRDHCGSLRGLPAALCISDVLARQFPFGASKIDFFDLRFEPTGHLRTHTAGAPGHCVNRSAILAGQLLAVGIPARVIQFFPPHRSAHTLVEVWDDRFGWALVDPTVGGVLGDSHQPTSALELRRKPESANWIKLSEAPAPTSLVESTRRQRPDAEFFRGRLVYPEPWLYLRVGPRYAPWPFRGSFAHLGSGRDWFGLSHAVLRLGIVLCAFGSMAFFLVTYVGFVRARGLLSRP